MRIKILDAEFNELGVIRDVISAEKREGLNSYKELQFSTILTPEMSELIVDNIIAEVDDDYYDLAYFQKAQQADGMLSVSAEFEHVSYRLNNPEYDMEYFTEIGTPAEVLGKILAGTDFTVGTVEFTETVTFSIQEKSSRRKMLMEFVSYLGGEVDFNKFEISILKHRGSTEPNKDITEGRNFEILAVSFDKRQRDDEGNALVAYTCKLIRPMDISLGDVVTMRYGTLGIDTSLRVVSVTTNPYNTFDVEFEIGNFNSTLENDIYRIETSTVVKDKLYYGARIGPEYGFESVRNDKLARAFFNADAFKMQSGDGEGNWTDELYFDPTDGKYYFNGKLTATALEAVKANIDLVVSQTVITESLYAEKGYIAELTVDQLDTSQKVKNYLANNRDDVNYIKVYEQNIEFRTGKVKTDEGGTPLEEQAVDRFDKPLYWVDDTYKAVAYTANDMPVMVYQYDETIKMKISFIDVGGTKEPFIVLGVGIGNPTYPDRGKAFIHKDTEGLLLKYVKSDGEEVFLRLGENGAEGNAGRGIEVTAIDFTLGGMDVSYADSQTHNWEFSYDGEGRISQMKNMSTNRTISVSYLGS